MTSGTVSADEVAKFDRLAQRWWDPNGPMQPLHRMNPARIAWINGLLSGPSHILDVGCGAGLAAESLARLGHDVLGIDAAAEAIEAARAHAARSSGSPADSQADESRHPEATLHVSGAAATAEADRRNGAMAAGTTLRLEYRTCTAEDLQNAGQRFQVIIALEVIEHVPNPAVFARLLASLLDPGGLLVLSTLNRTRRSFLTAKLGAEYLLRLLPAGTHDWRAFLTPAELARLLRMAGLRVHRTTGLLPGPLSGQWRTGRDMSVNYMMAAVK